MPSRYTSIKTKVVSANNGVTNIYKTVKYPEIPLSVNDIYAYTTQGDRLDLLAQQFYGDINLWWVIASANPDKVPQNSLFIPTGTELRIPTDLIQIKSLYNKLNNI
jgi:phage tail protein X